MKSFFGVPREELSEVLGSRARAARAFQAIYQENAPTRDELPFSLDLPALHRHFDSEDQTRRFLFRLHDGQLVESVRIPREGRDTFCVSSQIGCALGCTFCLTGKLGLTRDLSAAEIVSQVLLLKRDGYAGRFSVVLMGMGEPLQNYDNVLTAIGILHDDYGLKVPMTRITLSTAGLIPGIQRLAGERLFPNLSISLTGATNEVRDKLMPINRRYPIEDVIQAIRDLPHARGKRVMFEYVMIKGVTDSLRDAEQLSRLLRGMAAKVNLIPLNPAEEIPFERSSDDVVLRFQEILVRNGTATFIRKNRGNDVCGACGQLSQVGTSAPPLLS